MLHPRLNPKYDEYWTKPTSLESWQGSPKKTVKLDVLAQVVKHHLASDGQKPVNMQDNGKTLAPHPDYDADMTDSPECDRIIVYSVFPSSNGAILDVSSPLSHTPLSDMSEGV